MVDRVILSQLVVRARHGVLQEEARLGQRFLIDLACEVDLSESGKTDNYNQAVCYQALADIVTSVATRQRFNLIEALAEAIADEVFRSQPRVDAVSIRVEKPEAPLEQILDTVAIEIERRRPLGSPH